VIQNMMTEHSDNSIPPANTPAEINIHLGYIRRDILNLQEETRKSIGEVSRQISNLDDHYITESEYRPIAETVKSHEIELRALKEWRDTFNGKMLGFGTAIALASTLLSFALNYFF